MIKRFLFAVWLLAAIQCTVFALGEPAEELYIYSAIILTIAFAPFVVQGAYWIVRGRFFEF